MPVSAVYLDTSVGLGLVYHRLFMALFCISLVRRLGLQKGLPECSGLLASEQTLLLLTCWWPGSSASESKLPLGDPAWGPSQSEGTWGFASGGGLLCTCWPRPEKAWPRWANSPWSGQADVDNGAWLSLEQRSALGSCLHLCILPSNLPPRKPGPVATQMTRKQDGTG